MEFQGHHNTLAEIIMTLRESRSSMTVCHQRYLSKSRGLPLIHEIDVFICHKYSLCHTNKCSLIFSSLNEAAVDFHALMHNRSYLSPVQNISDGDWLLTK